MHDFIHTSDKKSLHCIGVYQIKNTITNKLYVGSSKEVYHRIHKHKYLLRRGIHPNPHLQSSFDKYGISSFEVSLIEVCDNEHIAEREAHWIKQLDCLCPSHGYNQAAVTKQRGNDFCKETRSKTSKTLMGDKNIWMVDKTSGDKIKMFESLFDAAEYILSEGITKSPPNFVRMKISMAARNKVVSTGNGRKATRSSAYGYKWEVI